MHIITGLLVAGLVSGMGRKEDGTLPRMVVGPLQVPHQLRGRIRFRVPALQGDAASSAVVEERLFGIVGVKTVTTNAVTGSILVEFDQAVLAPDLLLAAVARLLGLEEALDKAPVSELTRELRDLGKGLDQAVYQFSSGLLDLPTMAALVLLAGGARKMYASGGLAFPAGFTLMWWGLNMLRGRPAE